MRFVIAMGWRPLSVSLFVLGFLVISFNNCSEPFRSKKAGRSAPSSMQIMGLKTVDDLQLYTRLTKTEYRFVIEDLLQGAPAASSGDMNNIVATFNENLYEGYYKNHTQVNTYPNIEKDQLLFAKRLANYFLESSVFMGLCSEAGNCVIPVIRDLLPRIWKKKISTKEVEELQNFYNSFAANERDFYLFFRIFASPNFHYKIFDAYETDGSRQDIKLGNLLSFYLTGSFPDSELQQDIEAGKLSEAGILRSHVERLLGKYPDRFASLFAVQWLGTSSLLYSTDKYKNVSLPEVMAEPANILGHLIGDDEYISSLYELKYNIVNPNLAGIYGLSGVTGWQRVQATKTLFGTAFMSYFTTDHENNNPNPILRGSYIVNHLLCRDVQFPTSAIQEQVDEIVNNAPMGLSPPDRMSYFRGFPACASCHDQFDFHGLALEQIAALGEPRTKYYTGHDIETKGKVDGIQYSSSLDFVNKLSRSEIVNNCFASQVFNYISSTPYTKTNAVIKSSDLKNIIAGKTIRQVVVEMVLRGLGGE